MQKKYVVMLSVDERAHLEAIVRKGESRAEVNRKARILLKADQSEGQEWMSDVEISKALDVSVRTVERLRERFVEEGFESCMTRKKSNRRPHNFKVDGAVEAQILAIATSGPPSGRASWTLSLIGEKLVELKAVDSISRETISKTLKKTRSSHGRKKNGV